MTVSVDPECGNHLHGVPSGNFSGAVNRYHLTRDKVGHVCWHLPDE